MKVHELFNTSVCSGDFGIEVEVEGKDIKDYVVGVDGEVSTFWASEGDGSLRGEESMEYVLNQPVVKEELPLALYDLEHSMTFNGTTVDESERTSVHVHINYTNNTIAEVINTCILYYMVEEALFKFCGEFRKNNFYCLPVTDAQYPIEFLKTLASRPSKCRLTNFDELRYSALNLAALKKYGSLEFRGLRGTTDANTILQWCRILYSIKEAACSYDNPKEILKDWNELSIEEFVDKNFSSIRYLLEGNWQENFIVNGSMALNIASFYSEKATLAVEPRRRTTMSLGDFIRDWPANVETLTIRTNREPGFLIEGDDE